jgi:hypothetical protein
MAGGHICRLVASGLRDCSREQTGRLYNTVAWDAKIAIPVYMIEQLRVLFDRLLAELPQGAAELNVYRVPRGDGTVIEIVPSNSESASFGVHVDDGAGYVDFSFGRIGTWELPEEGRNRKAGADQLLLEVEQMSKAVIAGKCEETRNLFSITSRIHVDGYTYKVVDFFMLPVPPFGTRKYAAFISSRTKN